MHCSVIVGATRVSLANGISVRTTALAECAKNSGVQTDGQTMHARMKETEVFVNALKHNVVSNKLYSL